MLIYGVGVRTRIPPSGGYIAHAVNFSSACLNCTSLTATDNGLLSFSFWINNSVARPSAGGTLFEVDIGGNFTPNINASFLNTMRINMGHNGGPGKWFNTFSTPDGWNHYLGSIDTNQATGSRKCILYIN